MFEQLHGRLVAATYPSTTHREAAAGAVVSCLNELAALGVNVGTADSGTAATARDAISLVKVALSALTVSATFSMYSKQAALGRLDALGNQLASLGLV